MNQLTQTNVAAEGASTRALRIERIPADDLREIIGLAGLVDAMYGNLELSLEDEDNNKDGEAIMVGLSQALTRVWARYSEPIATPPMQCKTRKSGFASQHPRPQ